MTKYERDVESCLVKNEGTIVRYNNLNPDLSCLKLAKKISIEKGIPNTTTLRGAISKLRSKTYEESKETPKEFNLPQSDYQEIDDLILPKNLKNVLILNDVHIPQQVNWAVEMALKYGKDHRVDTVYLNGDIVDFHPISRHQRNPNFRDLNAELTKLRQFLEEVRRHFPNAKIYYKLGNHEDRLRAYLWNTAPELANVKGVEFRELAGLDNLGIELVESTQITRMGSLYVAHGHEVYNGAGAINISRVIFLRTFVNIAVGHFHRTTYDPNKRLNGTLLGSWTIGCLCGLNPMWARVNRWNFGWMRVELDEFGNFEVHNKQIVNGVVK